MLTLVLMIMNAENPWKKCKVANLLIFGHNTHYSAIMHIDQDKNGIKDCYGGTKRRWRTLNRWQSNAVASGVD